MTNINIDPHNSRCLQDNCCPRLCSCTAADVLDDESTNLSAAVDDQRAAANHPAQSEGDVITVAMPIMLGADGQLYYGGSESVIGDGGDQAVQAAVALLLEQFDLRPAPKTNIAWADVSLWIEFRPREGDGSWDMDRVEQVEDEFRLLLLPLGLRETGSGGWLPFSGAPKAGTRDISFVIPAGTDLFTIRDRLEPHDFGCDWTFELEVIEPDDPVAQKAIGTGSINCRIDTGQGGIVQRIASPAGIRQQANGGWILSLWNSQLRSRIRRERAQSGLAIKAQANKF